jgi:hypothetical protein
MYHDVSAKVCEPVVQLPDWNIPSCFAFGHGVTLSRKSRQNALVALWVHEAVDLLYNW